MPRGKSMERSGQSKIPLRAFSGPCTQRESTTLTPTAPMMVEMIRYPVFLRKTKDHRYPLTDLLADRTALDQAIQRRSRPGCRSST